MIINSALVVKNDCLFNYNLHDKTLTKYTDISVNSYVLNKTSLLQRGLLKEGNDNIYDLFELLSFLFPKDRLGFSAQSILSSLTSEIITNDNRLNNAQKEALAIFKIIDYLKIYLKNLSRAEKQDIINFIGLIEISKYKWNFLPFLKQSLDFPDAVPSDKLDIYANLSSLKNNNKKSFIDNSVEIQGNISNNEVLNTLSDLTKSFENQRSNQQDYSLFVKDMFINDNDKDYNFLFAEAGTGVGKTFGYLSAVLSFLKKNPSHQVIISTYTKVLQKQIYQDLYGYYKDKKKFASEVAIGKGSSNYICLLNFEYAKQRGDLPKLLEAIISRLFLKNIEGDLEGFDINPMIFELFSSKEINNLRNNKEECIYSRCKFYDKCFIMNAKKKVQNANLVIANHTYSLINSSSDNLSAKYMIFDEAHHLFNVADDVFASEISINSILSLYYWVIGYKKRNKVYALNGLKSRIQVFLDKKDKDISQEEEDLNLSLDANLNNLLDLFKNLITENIRFNVENNIPQSIMEDFFYNLHQFVLDNSKGQHRYYNLETEVIFNDLSNEFKNCIIKTKNFFEKIKNIAVNIKSLLQSKAYFLDLEDTYSLSELIKSFEYRCIDEVQSYIDMLGEISNKKENHIYRFMILKEEGITINTGYFRNYINPMEIFSQSVLGKLNGVTFTSATLCSVRTDDFVNNYLVKSYGLDTLDNSYINFINLQSPFNYEANSKVLIIQDANIVNNKIYDSSQIAKALEQLFVASSGGGLCIFTSVDRLKKVYHTLKNTILKHDINLLAQHVNKQKISYLLEIFKDDKSSCMLGTDSTRDGIDIPGNSLRLVVFEKIPWAKPDILFKSRVVYFGNNFNYDFVMKKLKQAFGRLIRTETDHGVFIMLDKSFPSVFKNSFPEGLNIEKVSLDQAKKIINDFLQ